MARGSASLMRSLKGIYAFYMRSMRRYVFSMRFYAILCDDSIFRNRGPAFTKMVRPATRPADLVFLPETHGWWRTATRGHVRLRTTIRQGLRTDCGA